MIMTESKAVRDVVDKDNSKLLPGGAVQVVREGEEDQSNPILPPVRLASAKAPGGAVAFNDLPSVDYPDSIRVWGAKNVERALIFVSGISDYRTGLAIALGSDDISIFDIIQAAHGSDRRAELNSESWVEKLSDAVETVRFSMTLPITLLPDGSMRVTSLEGDVLFQGRDWDFVRWVRDTETVMIDADPNQERGD